jgi:O-antigen/teichoic acid export membrane protein
MLLSSTRPWVELGAICLVLTVSHSFRDLAWAQLTATALYLMIFWAFSYSTMPEIRFDRAAINYKTFKEIAPAAAAFQALPLANALIFQGSLVAVQAALGPAAVAVFATIRTVIRTVSQIIEAMNQAVWPELSHSIAAQDQPRSRYLHRFAVNSAAFASIIGAITMVIAGPSLYNFWLGKKLIVPDHVFWAFCLLLPFNCIWVASSVVQMASNQHIGFAIRYLGYAVISIAACYPLTVFFGLVGTALSGAVMDLCLLRYVIHQSLRITDDNVFDMLKSTDVMARRFAHHLTEKFQRN